MLSDHSGDDGYTRRPPQMSKSGGGNRALWAAVVWQALQDIESERYGSTDYTQSVTLLTAPFGPWAVWRQEIADMLDLHGDDLMHAGRLAIADREALETPPPPIPIVHRSSAPRSGPVPEPYRAPVVRRRSAKSDPDRVASWIETFMASRGQRVVA